MLRIEQSFAFFVIFAVDKNGLAAGVMLKMSVMLEISGFKL